MNLSLVLAFSCWTRSVLHIHSCTASSIEHRNAMLSLAKEVAEPLDMLVETAIMAQETPLYRQNIHINAPVSFKTSVEASHDAINQLSKMLDDIAQYVTPDMSSAQTAIDSIYSIFASHQEKLDLIWRRKV